MMNTTKKIISLTIVMILLLTVVTQIVIAVQYFPPSANWQAGANTGAGTYGELDDDKIYIRCIGHGEYKYYVTKNTIPLSQVSFIEIDWKGTWIGGLTGNLTFGIATNQMDSSFDDFISHNAAFVQQTESLDVSSYNGNYYLKFGGNVTGGAIDYLYGWLYNVSYYNYTDSTTKDTTAIEEETATLNGELDEDGDIACTVGFLYNNSSVLDINSNNVTATNSPRVEGQTFYAGVSGLTPGEYYYVKSWSNNSNTYNVSATTTYFLTKPNPPTSLSATCVSARSITLSWVNSTIGDGTNRTTLIRYRTDGTYPTSITDGTLACNSSSNTYTLNALQEDTTYYFSAWTYVNFSGPTFLTQYSDEAYEKSGSTSGGDYNIYIKYEDNQTLVSNAVMAGFNHTCEARLRTGQILNETFPTTNPFWLNTTSSPDVMFFDFKNRTLWRAVMPEEGQRNITFYISIRPEYDTDINLSDSQIYYTFSFSDMTTRFVASNQSKLYIYKYNGTAKYYVHQDYWSAADTVDVPLQYGDRYYIGVWCPELYIPFVQYFDAHSTQDYEIQITHPGNVTYIIGELIYFNCSWDGGGNGLWVNYTDKVLSTENFTITIYRIWKNNTTRQLQHGPLQFSLNQKNYHWTTAAGCNNTFIYAIKIEIQHSWFSTNQTMYSYLPPLYSSVTNPDWINDWFDLLFGDSPFFDAGEDPSTDYADSSGEYVPWTQVVAFGVCMILLMTIGHINWPITMIGVGSLLIFLEAFLGVVETRGASISTVGILGGALLVILGFIMAIAGGGRKQ